MNFMDLSCFVMAAEEMNFTRAARRLYISQQSLSSHIAKLEEHYGARLFDRKAPLTMTKEGALLLDHAKAILSEERQARAELADLKEEKDCELRIGISGYRSSVMMPFLLPAFHEAHPECRVKLLEAPLAQVTEALIRGRVEIVIGYEVGRESGIQSDILYEEEIFLVIPRPILESCFTEGERKRLNYQTRVSFKTAANCPLILLGQGTWLRGTVDAFAAERDLELSPRVETASIDTMLSLCLEGMGAMVCPEIYLDQEWLEKEGFSVLRLSEPIFCKRIAVNYLAGKYQTKAAREFIKIAGSIFCQGWQKRKRTAGQRHQNPVGSPDKTVGM